MSNAVERFLGNDGLRRIAAAFLVHPLVNGDQELANKLSQVSKIETVPADVPVVTQGGADTEIFFILLGSVQIEVNGQIGPVRSPGDHFGEMTLIDVHTVRSATVRTREETIVARITEPDFTRIAAKYPILWRCLAVEIANRLRQRLKDVPQKNDCPHVFIGSSSEGLQIANTLKDCIADDKTLVTVWTDGVFGASDTTIESLEDAVRGADFAVLVLSPDDVVLSRGLSKSAPRDNVVFELGLFMGALGRKRVFALRPRAPEVVSPTFFKRLGSIFDKKFAEVKLPSDLLGVTTLTFVDDPSIDLASRLTGPCVELKKIITKRGAK